jgi:hypothetical protein
MRLIKWMALLFIPTGLAAFATQPYYTAEIYPGEASLTCGAEVGYFEVSFFDWWSGWEVSPQLSFRISPPRSGRFAFFADGGAFIERAGWGEMITLDSFDLAITPNGAIGVQYELSEELNYTAGVSAEYPYLMSLTIMKGFPRQELGPEIFTVGVKTLTFIPSMLFVNIHPSSRLHLHLGVSYIVFGGELHAGLGYTFGKIGGNSESL